ncbi:hypothetical protein [Nonomuraea sp. SYSU D8015]|uniref:hypothetical protein n=1 Tax=Nonomuraea sp. SYSU D8015 TaxID=2593644 RepID=UPI0016617551|nr:hypothetical protein [Nonomuraea sp. SYSU D8015]
MSDPTIIPEVGETWRLIDDWGVGPGALPAGTEVEILGIYPSGTPGIGYSEYDSVLFQYTCIDGCIRFLALPVPEFVVMFQKVS